MIKVADNFLPVGLLQQGAVGIVLQPFLQYPKGHVQQQDHPIFPQQGGVLLTQNGSSARTDNQVLFFL